MEQVFEAESWAIWRYEAADLPLVWPPELLAEYPHPRALAQHWVSRQLLAAQPAGPWARDVWGKWRNAQGQYLSLSHSGHYLGLAWGDKPLGLDIQAWDERLPRLLPRLMPSAQFRRLAPDRYLWHWTAREALYKAHPQGALSYARDIQTLDAPNPDSSLSLAQVLGQSYALSTVYGPWGCAVLASCYLCPEF